MADTIAGVDPGITGAVAILEGGRFRAGLFMPVFRDGKRQRVNAAALAGFLAEHRPAMVVLVTPQAWKRAAGLLGTDKGASLAVAARLFPGAPLTRKRDIALADALLIARFGGNRHGLS